jgi:aromatic-L-amino-acid/L-tryptophan decarboxylase
LRLWLPLHLHGVDAFVRALEEKLDLAEFVHAELSKIATLELPWSPELSLVAFRPRVGSDQDAQRLLDRINSTRRMWLSSATFKGKRYLRMCILSHRSHPARIREAVDIIRELALGG